MRVRLGVAALAAAGAIAAAAGAAANETLTVTVAGRGTVTSAPAGIACPPKCRVVRAKGTSIALRARPRAGWRFAGWSGGCRSQVNPRCTVWLRTAKRVQARFRPSVPPPPPPPAPRPTFTPQTLAGTWSGTWRNTTSGASGAMSIRFQAPDASTMIFTLTLAGNLFGCSDAPAAVTVSRGSGPNTWDASGFRVERTSAAGSFSLVYEVVAQSLIGTGRPGCRPDATWELRGTFAAPTFGGTLRVTLGGVTTSYAVELTRPAPP